jgi:hypothetical protein
MVSQCSVSRRRTRRRECFLCSLGQNGFAPRLHGDHGRFRQPGDLSHRGWHRGLLHYHGNPAALAYRPISCAHLSMDHKDDQSSAYISATSVGLRGFRAGKVARAASRLRHKVFAATAPLRSPVGSAPWPVALPVHDVSNRPTLVPMTHRANAMSAASLSCWRGSQPMSQSRHGPPATICNLLILTTIVPSIATNEGRFSNLKSELRRMQSRGKSQNALPPSAP